MGVALHETKKSLQLDSAAFSDPGKTRVLNQDTIFHQTAQTNIHQNVGLFLVCDGMGGYRGGEIASRIAVDTITGGLADLFASTSYLNCGKTCSSFLALCQKIQAVVNKANAEIRQYALNHFEDTPDLGTTLTLAVVYGDLAHIVNAGDGRVYAWRNGRLTQLTQDHSVAALLLQQGQIDESELVHHPKNHILLRALGAEDSIEVDEFDWELQAGDKLLLCSDGLWKAFESAAELEQRFAEHLTTAHLCHRLVNEAKQRDGSDNISAIIVSAREANGC
jgi:protein phosphatase